MLAWHTAPQGLRLLLSTTTAGHAGHTCLQHSGQKMQLAGGKRQTGGELTG